LAEYAELEQSQSVFSFYKIRAVAKKAIAVLIMFMERMLTTT
jgi:hypothetical protein